MSVHLDAKGVLVDKLGEDKVRFPLSNLILSNKRALHAVDELYKLKDMLFAFAFDPNVSPILPPRPTVPEIQNLSEDEARTVQEKHEKLMQIWSIFQGVHERKVSEKDYIDIMAYIDSKEMVLHATPAVKGLRFKAFTKNPEERKPGGLMAMLSGGDKE